MSKPDWFSFILLKSSVDKLPLWLASVLFFVWLPVASLNFRVMARYYEYERAKKPDWRGFWSTGSERESVYTNWPKTDSD